MKQNKTIFSLLIMFVMLTVVSFAVMAVEYNESPMLKEKVADGELPSVAERLPEEPLVIKPGVLIPEENLDLEIGQYGGTITSAHETPAFNPNLFNMWMYEPLVSTPGILGTDQIYANIVSNYTVNEDSTVYTFTLRKGLKWSDGVPVTTEDIRFTYEDVLQNTKLTATMPAKFRNGGSPDGEPMDLEIIDKYTFKISFEDPYGMFLINMSTNHADYRELLLPKHYMKQYHIKYTSLDDMKSELEEEQLTDEWWNLFNSRRFERTMSENLLDFPVLYAWRLVEGPAGTIKFARNPYYFKVDEEGNQLPYVDHLLGYKVESSDMLTMKAITGEIDFLFQGTSVSKMSLYKENEERGGFKVYPLTGHGEGGVFFINHTYEDPAWREVVSDIRFRKALNMAVDREEIIDVVYYGMASQPEAWLPTEYNVEKANQLLDEMGLDERNEDGYRLGPDGKPFTVFIEAVNVSPDYKDIGELVTAYWRSLDLNVRIKFVSFELFLQKMSANDLMIGELWANMAVWPDIFPGYLPGSIGWGQAWAAWKNTGGKEGEEPPAWIKEVYEIDNRLKTSVPGSEEKKQAAADLKAWYKKYIPNIHPLGSIVDPVIVNENIGNVPHAGLGMAANERAPIIYYFKE